METFLHGDLRFDVVDRGPAGGAPVVLLHGFPQPARSWSAVIPRLVDAGLRVLAPDQRGYSPGARPLDRRAYRLDVLAADVLALLDTAGLERAHVVGHDWGAAVAWALAVWHPDRLASVAALSAPHPAAFLQSLPVSTQALRSWYMLAFQVPALPERMLAVATPRGRDRLAASLERSGLPAESARHYADRLAAPGALTAAVNWYRGMPLTHPRRIRRPVTVPTLFVWGRGDRFISPRAAALTRRWVRGPYRSVALPGAGHWLPETHPDTVADLVTEHIHDST